MEGGSSLGWHECLYYFCTNLGRMVTLQETSGGHHKHWHPVGGYRNVHLKFQGNPSVFKRPYHETNCCSFSSTTCAHCKKKFFFQSKKIESKVFPLRHHTWAIYSMLTWKWKPSIAILYKEMHLVSYLSNGTSVSSVLLSLILREIISVILHLKSEKGW